MLYLLCKCSLYFVFRNKNWHLMVTRLWLQVKCLVIMTSDQSIASTICIIYISVIHVLQKPMVKKFIMLECALVTKKIEIKCKLVTK